MVHSIDPLTDARWTGFLAGHPAASVFHTPPWLEALRRTYGYEPFVLTTAAPGEEMKNGIVYCLVKSWLTGHRIVSLPFADHCQPLVESSESLRVLLDALREEQGRAKWKYIELRPLLELPGIGNRELGVGAEGNGDREPASLRRQGFGVRGLGLGTQCRDGNVYLGLETSEDTQGLRASVLKSSGGTEGSFSKSAEFYFHSLDLRPGLDVLFRNFHKSCVQRKIQRAEREQLDYEVGGSEAILAKFYRLLMLTRRRHQLPPQPLAWFRNLLECMGDKARIHMVSKDGQPIASILTLFFRNTLVYKYGCSDGRFHSLGGMPLLFWKAIQEGKQLGAQEFDLGRSDTDHPGLVEFKQHLGAACSTLTYYSYPPRAPSRSAPGWQMRVARHAFGWLPDSLLTTAGRLLYKHVG